jgi:hypothetical protein
MSCFVVGRGDGGLKRISVLEKSREGDTGNAWQGENTTHMRGKKGRSKMHAETVEEGKRG